MEPEIVPEPSEAERQAVLAALAELDGALDAPPAYRSPWRLAGLADADDAEP